MTGAISRNKCADLFLHRHTIMAEAGNVAWDMGSYEWLLQDKAFESIYPSLQHQAKLNMAYGLYD